MTHGWLTMFFYVDDMSMMYGTRDIARAEEFFAKLTQRFHIVDLGELQWFLGMRIIRDRQVRKLWLVQDTYWEKIYIRFNLSEAGKRYTKVPRWRDLEEYEGKASAASKKDYLEKVGSLIYVTTSSTEAELLALSQIVKEAIFMQRLFRAIGLELDEELVIQVDNRQTIRLVTEEAVRLITKLKHVDIYSHRLRETFATKKINIEWTPITAMVADGFIKLLGLQKHQEFIRLLNL
ncbi:hypothetical protein DL770_010326 [Monosporascus sp. CRB-9-2]|nr:hypothetical protein DL770_010326 [Monosporascus sp. CRB-9-2]